VLFVTLSTQGSPPFFLSRPVTGRKFTNDGTKLRKALLTAVTGKTKQTARYQLSL